MARRVEDLIAAMPLLAAPDEYDPTAVGMPVPRPRRREPARPARGFLHG